VHFMRTNEADEFSLQDASLTRSMDSSDLAFMCFVTERQKTSVDRCIENDATLGNVDFLISAQN
jgi:hypothetical protein